MAGNFQQFIHDPHELEYAFVRFSGHRCQYYIHKTCGELPQHIDHSLHPVDHPQAQLTLVKRDDDDHININRSCYYCGNENDEPFAYTCNQCSFYMHMRCALIPVPTITSNGAQENGLAQFVCHQYPMVLVENDGASKGEYSICFACQSHWSGPAYSCISEECQNFLHKSCADFPRQIRHPFHPSHTLTLQVSKPQSCHSCCKKDCRLIFKCLQDECDFHLGIECASLKKTVQCQSHDHLLSLIKKVYCDIWCDACQNSYKKSPDHVVPNEVDHTQSFLFRCIECNFNLHFLCGPLSLSIKCDYHIHALTLVDRKVIKGDSNKYFCNVCKEKMDPQFRVYYCANCKYRAHIHCLIYQIMQVIEENKNKNVKLWALGENQWYMGKEMLDQTQEKEGNETMKEMTLKDVVNSLTAQEKNNLRNPFGDDLSRRKGWYNYYREKNFGLFEDDQVRSIEDIDRIEQFFRFNHAQNLYFKWELWYYSPSEGVMEVIEEKYLRQKVVEIEGYMVPKTLAPILKMLLRKYGGHLEYANKKLSLEMKSITCSLVCAVIDRMSRTKLQHITKDLLQRWYFCVKAVGEITGFKVIDPLRRAVQKWAHAYVGIKAIRLEKEMSEKLETRITKLQAQLETCKQNLHKIQTFKSSATDFVKDSITMASELERRMENVADELERQMENVNLDDGSGSGSGSDANSGECSDG